MERFLPWLRQPTTIAGIAVFVGTTLSVALGKLDIGTAVPVFVGALTSMLLPDNAGAAQSAQVDAVAATARLESNMRK